MTPTPGKGPTPGPWRLTGIKSLRGWHEYDLITDDPDGPGTFATLRFENHDHEADALLVAAAPETAAERDRLQAENAALVAALQAFVIEPAFDHPPGHSPACYWCAAMGAARAALAATTRPREGGQANLSAVLAGLVLAVAALWLTGWVGDHAATAAHALACVSRVIGG